MLIALIGESCVGKSTIAAVLKEKLNATVYSGKDYLRLAKSETEAVQKFKILLAQAVNGDNIVYVITEKPHLAFLPESAKRVVVTAGLNTIKTRFAARTNGVLPPPLAKMLEAKHGIFDNEPCLLKIESEKIMPEEAANRILSI
ncbi:MAG TPA: hypothetical protein PK629_00595 [Oscillospiraceae bacterium]|nr:hypothetical protein [Oscillospiraceae bacterium]HPF56187.1 hypothetical protein [Clostridiales bacterium]HPK36474.1 hypothetical protein [Oscillospiraceae bacterium]HPR75772.1 hypothetical protein [Oscillospiraceae bacterium]